MFGPTRLKELARQLGYDDRTDVSVHDLGAFNGAPWLVDQGGSLPPKVLEVLHRQSAEGLFLLGDFLIDIVGDTVATQTVGAVRLDVQPPGLTRFVSKLQLPEGLHCVLRGDCVYIFVDTFSLARSSRLTVAEAASCLKALEHIAQGKFPAAGAQLLSIGASAVWSAGRVLPWLIGAVVWGAWVYALMTIPGALPGILGLGCVLLAIQCIVWFHMRSRTAAAKAYANRPIG